MKALTTHAEGFSARYAASRSEGREERFGQAQNRSQRQRVRKVLITQARRIRCGRCHPRLLPPATGGRSSFIYTTRILK